MQKTQLIVVLLAGIIIGLVVAFALNNSSPYAYAQGVGTASNMTITTGEAYDKGQYLYVLDGPSKTLLVYNGTVPGDGLVLLGARNIVEDLKLKDWYNRPKKYITIEEVKDQIKKEDKDKK
ncbi:MAG: hypothetical protein HZA48_04835 [Planctomycetes bacterium]|nr:hypothetical protein [Planctomycetota bacterium]